MKLINIFRIESWKKRLSFPFEYLKVKNLINRYYKNYFIIAPASNLGETVITVSLMNEFYKKYHGQNLLLVNNRMYEIAKLFKGVDEVLPIYAYYAIKKQDIKSISKGNIFPIFEKYLDSNFSPENMVDSHRYLLGLPKDIQPTKIKLDNNLILNIRNKYNIKPNTVLLSPEANSLNYKILSPSFWKKLANILTEKGYNILINTKDKNSYKEYNLIFDSILNTCAIAENCKCVIGFRSGLMDIFALSVSKKMFIIYPSDNYQIYLFMSNKEIKTYNNLSCSQWILHYSSLKTMFNNYNITETMFTGNEQLLIKETFDFIKKT
ncbi:hypothetical protein [Candidatus Ruminimicrobium bovinum]|uniref:hypothetical protein n=1 Tax=Candidatus Ruminimicrobium bovinum TaxID=3242779 RepID=UPI0039B83BA4